MEQGSKPMPNGSTRLRTVVQTHQRRDGRRFEILEAKSEGMGRLWFTWDPWIASLCQRAIATNQAVYLSWRETRYGLRLDQVRLLAEGEVAFERQLKADRV